MKKIFIISFLLVCFTNSLFALGLEKGNIATYRGCKVLVLDKWRSSNTYSGYRVKVEIVEDCRYIDKRMRKHVVINVLDLYDLEEVK